MSYNPGMNEATVTVRLPRSLLARLDARAEREGQPRSEVVRRLLAEALDSTGTAKALRALANEVRDLRASFERR